MLSLRIIVFLNIRSLSQFHVELFAKKLSGLCHILLASHLFLKPIVSPFFESDFQKTESVVIITI